MVARPCAIGPSAGGLASRRCHARRGLPLHRGSHRLAAHARAPTACPDRSGRRADRYELSGCGRDRGRCESRARRAFQAPSRTASPSPGWGPIWDEAAKAKVPRPEWLIEILRSELPEATPVFTDACEIGYRMHADWPSFGPRQFFYPSNYIALGWAFPAALGAAVALPGRHVVSVSGDGGFLMTAQELATAVRGIGFPSSPWCTTTQPMVLSRTSSNTSSKVAISTWI